MTKISIKRYPKQLTPEQQLMMDAALEGANNLTLADFQFHVDTSVLDDEAVKELIIRSHPVGFAAFKNKQELDKFINNPPETTNPTQSDAK